ncbi:MAG: hypothetical protein H6657_14300 [Ardenticatenaceae bacterium]|nr:hypothetical protein [Anaerolineales bacterium]MCB8978589.1 hypothetical protein [Ardenticatenaceae bacterium]
MKTWPKFLLLILLVLLAACGANAETSQETYTVDEQTGLPLNPDTIPEGDFVVEGTISSMNLTPQSAPEFVLRSPTGRTYRVRAQALPDILYDDGEMVGVANFVQGMQVRATISQEVGGPETGNTTQLVTDDLMILR